MRTLAAQAGASPVSGAVIGGGEGGYALGMDDLCEWPVDARCLPEITDENRALVRDAVDTAVMVLWALTGRRFGVCPTEYVLPYRGGSCPPVPRLVDGAWVNQSGGPPGDVVLPGPVYSVTSVHNDVGEELPVPVLDGDTLRAVPPEVRFVRYLRGEPVPPGAGERVGILARERYLQCVGDSRCRLPRNATSVTRQGVSVQMPTPQEIIDSGSTGLPEVDLWVRALNPGGDSSVSEVIV